MCLKSDTFIISVYLLSECLIKALKESKWEVSETKLTQWWGCTLLRRYLKSMTNQPPAALKQIGQIITEIVIKHCEASRYAVQHHVQRHDSPMDAESEQPADFLMRSFLTCAWFYCVCGFRCSDSDPLYRRMTHVVYTCTVVSWQVPNSENEQRMKRCVFWQVTDDSNEQKWHQALKSSTFLSLLVVFTKPSKPGV